MTSCLNLYLIRLFGLGLFWFIIPLYNFKHQQNVNLMFEKLQSYKSLY